MATDESATGGAVGAADTAQPVAPAERLFPSMAPPAAHPAAHPAAPTAAPVAAPETQPDGSDGQDARTTEERAQAFYDGGSAAGDYGPHIGQLVDDVERAARTEGDSERVQQLAETRRTLNEGLKELRVGAADARDVFVNARSYVQYPKSAETVARMEAESLKALRRQYGDRTDQVVAAASRVVDVLETKTPGVRDFLEASGMGNDLQTIQAAIRVAQRNGWLR